MAVEPEAEAGLEAQTSCRLLCGGFVGVTRTCRSLVRWALSSHRFLQRGWS